MKSSTKNETDNQRSVGRVFQAGKADTSSLRFNILYPFVISVCSFKKKFKKMDPMSLSCISHSFLSELYETSDKVIEQLDRQGHSHLAKSIVASLMEMSLRQSRSQRAWGTK